MATIVFPCEPRVLVNQEALAQNLVDSVALKDRHLHDVWLIVPYRGREAVTKMLDILRGQFHDLKTLEVPSPQHDSYLLVTSMFTRLVQVLYEEKGEERPVVWVSERGNEFFREGAIASLDTIFLRRPCNTIAGKYFTVPTRDTGAEVIPEHNTIDGTFVMTSKLVDRYPTKARHSNGEHFRVYLADVLTDNLEFIQDWEPSFIQVGEVPDTSNYKLPDFSGTVVVTKPQDIDVARFHGTSATLSGQREQSKLMTARDFVEKAKPKIHLSTPVKKPKAKVEAPVTEEPTSEEKPTEDEFTTPDFA